MALQTRTFCFRQDNVDACANAFYNDLFVNDTVNIGSDYEVTVLRACEHGYRSGEF
jgi:nucleoside-diphosphate-sugar epimerase